MGQNCSATGLSWCESSDDKNSDLQVRSKPKPRDYSTTGTEPDSCDSLPRGACDSLPRFLNNCRQLLPNAENDNEDLKGTSIGIEPEQDFIDEYGVRHHVNDHTGGYASASDSDVSCELEVEDACVEFMRPREKAVFCTKFGEWNRRLAGKVEVPSIPKTRSQMVIIEEVIQTSPLFRSAVELEHEELVANAMSLVTFGPGEVIVSPDQAEASAFYILLEHDVQCSKSTKGKAAKELHPGACFGECALLWHDSWHFTATAGSRGCTMGILSRSLYQSVVVAAYMQEVERRIECLHKCKFLERFNDEQIMKLVETLQVRKYPKGQCICREGQTGHHFFIIESGEVSEIKGQLFAVPSATHKEGDMLGEEALFAAAPRRHTLKCETDVEVLVLSRRKFERLKGPLAGLLEEQALTDPRHILSQFFAPGTHHGPRGTVETVSRKSSATIKQLQEQSHETQWFVVFRPTSRDAITKLVSGQGVGKGLNVKGKSAKKGILSAFVPFLQISENDHKKAIEASPPDSYVKVFYRSKHAQEDAFRALQKVHETQHQHLHYDRPYHEVEFEDLVTYIDTCPPAYGLRMPEVLLHEAYIELEDLRPHTGWETGRKSEPAFMDMNLHSVRDHRSRPEVVLYQHDEGHPMNGHGLLIAYEEDENVKPVVSDFDAFLVGSKGMTYTPLPANQAKLATWSVERTEEILRSPQAAGWTERWLTVLHDLAEKGEHHDLPECGYGDDTSIDIIRHKIEFLKDSGSIRHGAECFNFHFPQELDEEYLVISEGFSPENWKYLTEPDVRMFLIQRATEGYTFPLNPVWPIRDKGWYDVLQALRQNDHAKGADFPDVQS